MTLFQSLRRDVLDSYPQTDPAPASQITVSIAQARCFGFLLLPNQTSTYVSQLVSIAQARCFGFLHEANRYGQQADPMFQSLRRDVLDSYSSNFLLGFAATTVSIAQARCFGFLRRVARRLPTAARCFNRSGAMFWIPTHEMSEERAPYTTRFNRSGAMFWIPTLARVNLCIITICVSIAQARCFGFLRKG